MIAKPKSSAPTRTSISTVLPYRETASCQPQHTLASCVGCSGTGLHSGVTVTMTLNPAPANSGIRLKRTDLPGTPEIAATWRNACETPLCTTLVDGQARVATVEHLMAALASMGVDNVLVEVDGPEVPIMDGSAAPFVFLVECAGLEPQETPRRAIRIEKPIRVPDDGRSAALEPARQGLTLDVEIDFDSAVIGQQHRRDYLDRATFKRDLARARTFGFLSDVDKLRAAGLALGGSLDNAVVIDQGRILNEGGLRYPDEFVRHKILDSIGDLYLAGVPIIGRFVGRRTGHALNLRLLAAVFADTSAWRWVEPSAADLEPPMEDGPTMLNRAVALRP